jgi:hypothetical protein
MIMSEENAWRKRRRYNFENSGYSFTYFWHNACTGEDRDMTEEQFNNSNLQNPN